MNSHISLKNSNAISEIVGSVILLLIAVLSFTAIYMYVFPLPGYSADSNVDIQGSVSGKYAELFHVGGESVESYQVFADGELVYKGKNLRTGDSPITFEMSKKKMNVVVVATTDDGGTKIIFEGDLETKEQCDFEDPIIIDNSPSSGTTGDAYTFNITVFDENKVFCWANWSHGEKSGNISLQQIGSSSNYTATIISDHNVSNLTYYLYVSDYWDCINKTIDKSVNIVDNDPPEIELNTILHITEFYNLSADITDNINVQHAMLNITYPNGNKFEFNLSKDNDTYYYSSNFSMIGEYTYYMYCFDGIYQNNSETDSFIISDGETNLKPDQKSPHMYSSLSSNTSGEDLICINGSSSDPEGDIVTSIYTWYKNDQSFAGLYLPFNSNSSSLTHDYTDPKNNGTITNATWHSEGIVGGCYAFDNSEKITCSLPSAFTDVSNNDFAITIWIKSNEISTNQNCVLEIYNDGQNFVQIFQHDSSIYAGISVENTKQVLKTDSLSSDTWYHIGLLWNSDKTSLELFVNGSKYDINGDNSMFTSGDESLLCIGQKTDESDGWDGCIDELYVYNHLVTEDHIYQQYLCTRNGASNVSVIVSEETSSADTWYCYVTPNDGHQDGQKVKDFEITIE